MKKLVLAFAILIALSVSATAGEITVAAGAGLKDVLSDLSASFAEKDRSVKIIKNIVVSGALARHSIAAPGWTSFSRPIVNGWIT